MKERYGTLVQHYGHDLVCDTDGKSSAIICDTCDLELLVDEDGYHDLENHIGHDIVCVLYGAINVAIECETCNQVLYCVNVDREDAQDEDAMEVDEDNELGHVYANHVAPLNAAVLSDYDDNLVEIPHVWLGSSNTEGDLE